jgi:hypothetical protein
MRKLTYNLVLFVLLFSPVRIYGQEIPVLVTRLEKVFKQNEPKWKLQRPYVQLRPPVMHLKSSLGDALIYVEIMESAKAAGEAFEGNTIAFGNTMGGRGRRAKLPNFAEENYIFTGFVVGGTTTIFFRQGNIFINVSAPNKSIAKRFALLVLNEIRESAEIKTSFNGAIERALAALAGSRLLW